MKQALLSLLMALLPLAAVADAVEIGGIYYNLDSETMTAEVTINPNYYTGTISIPERVSYNDVAYSVTSIGERAFKGCTITNINIPNSVTKIGSSAFINCQQLTRVNLPEFLECIESNLFNGCMDLKDITIPNSVSYIDSYAFKYCGCLKDIIIPNSVTRIENYAFYMCGLSNAILGNSLAYIGIQAFYSCGLTSIVIPSSVKEIGESAFGFCSKLESIKVDSDNSVFDSRNDCNAIIDTKSNTLILGCKSTIIPNSVTTIGQAAFAYCNLDHIVIPNSVKKVDGSAFWDCKNLNEIHITDIAAWCRIDLSEHPFRFANHYRLFINEQEITDLVIPNSVTSISDFAFCGCESITSVTIPNSVTNIGGKAFYECSNLASVSVPSSVVSVGAYSFDKTSWLDSQPEGVVYLGKVAYLYKGAVPNEVFLTEGTVGIADGAFINSVGLKSVSMPNSVINIGNFSFEGCRDLASLIIPASVRIIGYNAFFGCSSFTSVDIPNSVTSIGEGAFYNCRSLTNVTIPYTLPSIGVSVFSHCTALKSIDIPNSVTSIGDYAFSGCYGLTSVIIPNSVTSIGDFAYDGCKSLTRVTIPSSVTSIGGSAFYGCTSLMEVKSLLESPYDIEDRVFSYQTYQQGTLYIPKGTMSLYTSLDGWRKFQNIVEMSDDDILNNIHLANDYSEKVSVEVEENGFNISNARKGTICQVFSTEGRLLKTVTLPGDSTFIGVTKGQIYIVKVGDKTFKAAL